MTSPILQNRLAAAMLGGLACGIAVLGLLYLLWPGVAGPLPPVLIGVLGVASLAGGAFGAVFVLGRTKHG